MSVTISQTASFQINGVTATAGSGFTLLANPQLLTSNVSHQDYYAEIFTVNPLTSLAAQSMGAIVTGKVLWMQTDIPVTVTLNQGTLLVPIWNSYVVDSFLFTNATFVEIQLSNSNATTAAHINIVMVGDRVVNPGTPGIY